MLVGWQAASSGAKLVTGMFALRTHGEPGNSPQPCLYVASWLWCQASRHRSLHVYCRCGHYDTLTSVGLTWDNHEQIGGSHDGTGKDEKIFVSHCKRQQLLLSWGKSTLVDSPIHAVSQNQVREEEDRTSRKTTQWGQAEEENHPPCHICTALNA